MPEKKTTERARKAKREGKAPSTQAGEFVREEMHHVRRGKHGSKSKKQTVAIGLSKARRAGVDVPAKKGAKKGSATKSKATKSRATKSKATKSKAKSKTAKSATKRGAAKRASRKSPAKKRTAKKRTTTKKRGAKKRATKRRAGGARR